jgi:hypothetical protein
MAGNDLGLDVFLITLGLLAETSLCSIDKSGEVQHIFLHDRPRHGHGNGHLLCPPLPLFALELESLVFDRVAIRRWRWSCDC